MPQNRSSEELQMRDLIVPELRRLWPDARIVHELPLRYSSNRIDLAAIRPAEIISVEIKSSRDVSDRLEAQVRAFLPISALVIVALAPKWNEDLPVREVKGRKFVTMRKAYTEAQGIVQRISDHSVAVWTVDAAGGTVKETKEALGYLRNGQRNKLPWLAQMLDVLWVSELEAIARAHRIAPFSNHANLVRQLAGELRGREIVPAVCHALRARDAFGAGTDAPLKEKAPGSNAAGASLPVQAALI